LMAEPRLLLLDEPSMGLAPIVVRDIFTSLRRLNEEGLALLLVEQDARIALSLAHRGLVMERGRIVLADLLVEQDARIALSLAHRGLVMERGRIVLADSSQALLENPEVREIYFGRRSGARSGGRGMENS